MFTDQILPSNCVRSFPRISNSSASSVSAPVRMTFVRHEGRDGDKEIHTETSVLGFRQIVSRMVRRTKDGHGGARAWNGAYPKAARGFQDACGSFSLHLLTTTQA